MPAESAAWWRNGTGPRGAANGSTSATPRWPVRWAHMEPAPAHLRRVGVLPAELRQRRHAAAPATGPRPAGQGPRRGGLRRLEGARPATPEHLRRTSTRSACPSTGSTSRPSRTGPTPATTPTRPSATPSSASSTASAPDVVHFHPLQSFGASLVKAAKDAGAATVVTMHDFWWWCARQFLVDRSFRPCNLVVEAGACACEVDRPFLEHRNERARRAPPATPTWCWPRRRRRPRCSRPTGSTRRGSRSTRTACPTRRRRPTVARVRTPGEPVRFLYTGGTLEMKGSHVLVAAAASLRTVPGWRVITYGMGEYLDRLGGPDHRPGPGGARRRSPPTASTR